MSKKFNNYPTRNNGLSVEVRDDFNRALRTFGKKVQDAGVLRELKERMYHEPRCIENTKRKKLARKRWEKKVEGMITAGLWHQDKPY